MLEQASGRSDGSRKSQSKFDNLYKDAVRRNERKMNIYSACLDAECTFQPEIELSQMGKVGKRRYSSGNREQRRDNLFERLS